MQNRRVYPLNIYSFWCQHHNGTLFAPIFCSFAENAIIWCSLDKLALFKVQNRGIFNANFSFKVLNLLYLFKYLYSYNRGRNLEGDNTQ